MAKKVFDADVLCTSVTSKLRAIGFDNVETVHMPHPLPSQSGKLFILTALTVNRDSGEPFVVCSSVILSPDELTLSTIDDVYNQAVEDFISYLVTAIARS